MGWARINLRALAEKIRVAYGYYFSFLLATGRCGNKLIAYAGRFAAGDCYPRGATHGLSRR
ncbi:hypothetical protein HH1059_24360 [Halorhodospira halochloris]|uniref:Uncharacterized protein n=1 Tax=Halorhodospira halochloris TaxID=1052 RepID=A0A2Z6F059_HALHR|nr:hypothetical protein HH1059_24360 [Halorhodospira halochloris]